MPDVWKFHEDNDPSLDALSRPAAFGRLGKIFSKSHGLNQQERKKGHENESGKWNRLDPIMLHLEPLLLSCPRRWLHKKVALCHCEERSDAAISFIFSQ
jgi:hypothetical protein